MKLELAFWIILGLNPTSYDTQLGQLIAILVYINIGQSIKSITNRGLRIALQKFR